MPQTAFIVPSLSPFFIARFSAAGVEPERKATAYSGRYFCISAAFWRASTSVGASMAACRPDFKAIYMPASATAVLPLPTSPCTSLFMTWGRLRSVYMALTASFCPAVNSKGKREANCFTSSAVAE